MIISHEHKFIFIKTMKTAGTSIEVFLSRHCGEKDILTPIFPPVDPHRARNYRGLWNPLPEIVANGWHDIGATIDNLLQRNRFFNHIPAMTVRQRIPRRTWNTYFKFCVERNPWDKTLSHYHMINSRAGGGLSFDEYLARGDFCINYPTYTDPQGRILVDRVVRYESMKDELGTIFQELGIPFEGSLGVRAKSEYRTDRRPYREVYNEHQRKVIEDAFAREIAMHNYAF